MKRPILVLDCGGSSTRAVLVSATGDVLDSGTGGPSNWASTPRELLTEHWKQAIPKSDRPVLALVAMAGLLTATQSEQAATLLRELSQADDAVAVPDFHATLASCDHEDAVCVISGTGSLVSSFSPNGEVVKSGGGGPLLGDWGSGYWAGRTALGRLLYPRDYESRDTGLREAMVEVLGSDDLNSAIATVYGHQPPAQIVAKLGSAVAKRATDGDELCQSILADAMQPLADLTIQHMRQNGFPQRKFKVYKAGGFWSASHFVSKYFEVQLHLPTYEPTLTPLEGAIRLAQRYATP